MGYPKSLEFRLVKFVIWEEKGAIQSESGAEGSTRRYNYLNVKKMLLIQEMIMKVFIKCSD
ncbi:hypothetical protein ACFSKI_13545 [Pseudogracilibacillus auburnensis]|uniref:hypothetical protein n=1 Tax=Pseudogracilibacillus auburnensis TaxID=1494959 RepID=UPI001B861985|nr:hypothetical protein [Pseudogracilibacillus auburnensis]